jgi:putative two-component system response regulator
MITNNMDKSSYRTYEACLNAVTTLVLAFEAKDIYTRGHSERVANMVMAIGKELGLSDDLVEKIRIAGMIYDIGKVGIPEAILNKPMRLTVEEYRYVQSHCEIGERILRPIVEDVEVLSMVKHHHERFNGQGYPEGLSGEQIPIGARILAVADAYDAMTTEKPYRGTMELRDVITELENNKGSQFDPAVVDALVCIRTKGGLSTSPLNSR